MNDGGDDEDDELVVGPTESPGMNVLCMMRE